MEVKQKTLEERKKRKARLIATKNANEKKERILQFQKEYKEIHNIDVSKKSKEWLAKNPEYKKAWIAFNTNKNLKKDFTVPEVVEVAPSVIDKSLVEIAFLKEQLAQMQEVTAEQQINNEETPENVVEEDISEELAYAIAITQQTPEQLTEKFKSDTRYKNKLAAIKKAKKKKAEDITTNKKKLSDDIKKSNKQIAKLEKELLQLRLLLIVPAKEKRKTNISKKTNNEIEKLEKAKNDYIHTKMQEFQL